MARQRKLQKNAESDQPTEHTKPTPKRRHHGTGTSVAKTIILLIVLFLSIAISYFYYKLSLENRIRTKLDKPNVVSIKGLDVPQRYWGSYRSGHYFGLKTRHKQSPVFGLMWFAQKIDERLQLRHWCDAGDNLQRYIWLKHDGENFGTQELVDRDVVIGTTFVKRPGGKFGGDWTARISVTPLVNSTPHMLMSLLFYTATNGGGELSSHVKDNNNLMAVNGAADALGNFSLYFTPVSGTVVRYNYLQTKIPPGMEHLKEVIMHNLALYRSKRKDEIQLLGLVGKSSKYDNLENQPHENIIVHQVTVLPPFEMDVIFESGSYKNRPNRLDGLVFVEELARHTENFDKKFEQIFKLTEKGFTKSNITVAKAIFSDMIGGIGYFYGSSLVQSKYNKEPVEYWPSELYTGVPSRAKFPRGFLWDEGFHNLLISQWSSEISKDILAHWLDLMNIEGWIPREVILGHEARARVPNEFIVQRNTNANPPALLLSYDSLVKRMLSDEIPLDKDFLLKSFSRLQVWFNWFNTTQVGTLPGSFRWRGRDSKSAHELNPKTLTSGLDDYPRASHPTDDERHIDLRCWMAFASRVMRDIAQIVGEPWKHYEDSYLYLSDNSKLEDLHWSHEAKAFLDYGLHTDNVKLVQPKSPPASSGQPMVKLDKVRMVLSTPKFQFVNSFGYVSLFPFLVQILKSENPLLGIILSDLRDPKLLWTEYGLRSLAKNSPMYMKYNTEHDGPYWRGPVWIHPNYMVLKALNFYSIIPGPFQEQSQSLYTELRTNVITNMLKEYKRTGYIWEHYNDQTGVGEGGHPFSGWSATVVLMMAELF